MGETDPKHSDLRLMKWLGGLLTAYGVGAVFLATVITLARSAVSAPDTAIIIVLGLIGTVIAAIGVSLVRSAARLGRRQRALDGQCVRCAYDLHGHPTRATCPECGMERTGLGHVR